MAVIPTAQSLSAAVVALCLSGNRRCMRLDQLDFAVQGGDKNWKARCAPHRVCWLPKRPKAPAYWTISPTPAPNTAN